MIDVGIRVTIFLNQVANAIGRIATYPLGVLPELPGAMLVWLVSGILMLIGFKYTSHQSAIKRIRDKIKAELIALSLFKDSVAVNLLSQWRILTGACQSILMALVPIACMIIPVTLLVGQLSLWWQVRPLHVDEEAVVTLNLSGSAKSAWPEVELQPSSAIESTLGPVQMRSKRALCWSLKAHEPGHYQLVFSVDGHDYQKSLAVGKGPMRVSVRRPEWKWTEVILHPAEDPFSPQSPVKSIEIQYPGTRSWFTGSNTWLISWFIGSMIVGFCFRGALNVNL